MRDIIILCKGPSASRCTKKIIEEYKEVAIVNHMPTIKNYEFLSERCDTLFKATMFSDEYTENDFKRLNIKKIVAIGYFNKEYKENFFLGVPIDRTGACIKSKIQRTYKFNPGTGLISIEYCINKGFDKICIIGLDLQKPGEQLYFFNWREAGEEFQKSMKNFVTDDSVFKKGWHPVDDSRKYLIDIITKNKQINFEIMSNDDLMKIASEKIDNLKIL